MDPREYDILAEEAQRGEPNALARLYRDLGPPLLGHLERILGERADAEDILHDAFVGLFEGRRRYRSSRGKFRQWIFTVATHMAIDRIRRNRRAHDLEPSAGEALFRPPGPGPAERIVLAETVRRVEAALADLPGIYAVAFHLRVREEFSYAEMAEIMNEPEGTLRSRVHRAVQQIREALEPGAGAASEIKERRERTR
jgi:RNA polymerase sigma-70 factor (ECF subfamily)